MARNTYEVDETLEKPFNARSLFRAGVYLKRYAPKMAGSLVLSAMAAICGLFQPIILQRALDVAIPDKNRKELFTLAGLLVVCLLAGIILNTIRSRIMVKVSQSIIYDIRKDLFAHLQKLQVSYYDDRPGGKILIRVVNYVNSVSDMLSNGLINIILESVNMIFIVVFMLAVNIPLGLVVLCGVPFLAAVMSYIKNHQRKAWQKVSNKNSNLNAYLQENVTGARVTQIFAREEENAEIFRRLSGNCREAWMEAVSYSNLVWPAIDDVSVVVRGAVFLVGLCVMGPARISIGKIVAVTSYAARFWQPIMNLGNIFNTFINNIAYLERIFETMDEEILVKDKEDAETMPPITGEVTFSHVTFSYEPGQTVLSDVSFTIKPGMSVALVGPTGAGKSTIVNLLSRFYNVDSGTITIDGVDITSVTQQSLRSQMGIMLQDSFIFSGTIADNVRYGKLSATDEEIEAACKTVCAHSFIMERPEGYATEVKERGSLLSQGQRQLISFARTLIADPRILILDEATSSIDVQTEKALQEGLNHMLKGRTSFIIAHRLSTIKNCDLIMFVSNKGIAEQGTHEELLKKKGLYYELYMSQRKDKESA